MADFVQAQSTLPFIGEAASLAAAVIWAFSMTLYTGPAKGMPAHSLNLYKNLVALTCFIIVLIVSQGTTATLRPDTWQTLGKLVLSGIIGIAVGDSAFFGALRHLGAQLTAAIQCLAPPMAATLAALAWGETLNQYELLGMILTTVAIGCLMFFGHQETSVKAVSEMERSTVVKGFAFAIGAALCQALGIVLARSALQRVDTVVGTVYRIVPAVLLLSIFSYQYDRGQNLVTIIKTRPLALRLAVAAFLGTFIGLFLMSVGSKYAKAGVTAALGSTYPIWIIPLARIYLQEKGSWPRYICTGFAIIGIILMVK